METAADYFDLMAEASISQASKKPGMSSLKWGEGMILDTGDYYGRGKNRRRIPTACIQGIRALQACATVESLSEDDADLAHPVLKQFGWEEAAFAKPLTTCPECDDGTKSKRHDAAGAVAHTNDTHGGWDRGGLQRVKTVLKKWAEQERAYVPVGKEVSKV